MGHLWIRGKHPDRLLMTVILLLTAMGMVYLYSTGAYYG